MVFANIKIIKPGPVLNLSPIYIHWLAVSSIFASLLPAFAAYLRYLPIFDEQTALYGVLGLCRSIAVLSWQISVCLAEPHVLKLGFMILYVEQILIFWSWVSVCLAVLFFRVVWYCIFES
jgi:hypothetical protein